MSFKSKHIAQIVGLLSTIGIISLGIFSASKVFSTPSSQEAEGAPAAPSVTILKPGESIDFIPSPGYLKLYGIPQTTYSYAYMTLFTADADELGSNPRHLKLTSTSQLSWAQYNSAQSKMSVDIIFTDGTTLRDSGLTDQGGVRVHPELRGVYATGVWYFFHVNLAPLAGKTVQHILIAYDSGSGNPTVPGTFRGYFDNVQLTFF